MKKLHYFRILLAVLFSELFLLSVQAADAKPPTKLTFQGFLTDSAGTAVGNTPVQRTIIFRIFNAETGGTSKWTEQQAVTVDRGHFSVLLGEGSQVGAEARDTDVSTVFSGSDASVRWMELTVDGAILTPRIQFVASPYTFLAKSATQLVDNTGEPVFTAVSGSVTIAGTTTGRFAGDGSNLTNLNGGRIAALTIPSAAIAASAVTDAKIAAGAITDSKIAAGAVTDAKIASGAVTEAKIAGGAVTEAKIAGGAVTEAKISSAPTTANSANTIVKRDGANNINVSKVTAASDMVVNNQSVVSAQSSYYIIAGLVPAGGITTGTGFSSSRLNTGYYRIGGLSGTPVSVVVSAYGSEAALANRVCNVNKYYSGGFDVDLYENGVRANIAMTLIVVMQR